MIKHMIEGPLAGAKKCEKSYRDRNRRTWSARTINYNTNSRFRRACHSIHVVRETLCFKRNRCLRYSCLVAIRFDGIIYVQSHLVKIVCHKTHEQIGRR